MTSPQRVSPPASRAAHTGPRSEQAIAGSAEKLENLPQPRFLYFRERALVLRQEKAESEPERSRWVPRHEPPKTALLTVSVPSPRHRFVWGGEALAAKIIVEEDDHHSGVGFCARGRIEVSFRKLGVTNRCSWPPFFQNLHLSRVKLFRQVCAGRQASAFSCCVV